VLEELSPSGWTEAMKEEMTTLEENGTWDLMPLQSGKKILGCRWVYALKLDPEALFKTCLVSKGYSETYRV